jgi:hypothetical protein
MRLVRRRLSPGEFKHELVWLTLSMAALAAGAVWLHFDFPWPACPFLAITGYPCLTCGATRCTIALLHGNLVGAFWWNPLAMVALAGLALFDLYAVIVLLTHSARLRLVDWTRADKNLARIAVIALILINWVYLLAHRTQF